MLAPYFFGNLEQSVCFCNRNYFQFHINFLLKNSCGRDILFNRTTHFTTFEKTKTKRDESKSG